MQIAPGATEPQAWIETFRELLRHYLPPLETSPSINVASLCAVCAGLFLTFRAAKFERAIVCSVAMLLGAWIGYRISLLIQTPEPISAAVGAVAMTALAYRTHRWWLACGSVVILFSAAVLFQLGRGDLQKYLPDPAHAERPLEDGKVSLVTQSEQLRNLHPVSSDQLAKVRDRLVEELRALGPMGWLIPLVAAVLGGLLAWWALKIFAVVWLSFLGSAVAVLGGTAFLCAHWPDLHQAVINRPEIPGQAVLGLWLLGLILQAKEARFPARKQAEPAKAAA